MRNFSLLTIKFDLKQIKQDYTKNINGIQQNIKMQEQSKQVKQSQLKSMLQQQYTPIRLLTHFKNSIHDGYFYESMKRQGPGITILDGGLAVLGNYKNDQNVGLTLIFLSFDTYFIGQFNKGALDGAFVIRAHQMTVYSQFLNNKMEGQLLLIDYQNWIAQLWTVDQTGEGQITKQINLADIMNSFISYEQLKRVQNKNRSKLDKTKFINSQNTILKSIAPYIERLPSISQFVKGFKLGTNQFRNLGPQLFIHKIFNENQLIMLNPSNLSNNSKNNQFLGIVLNKRQEVISMGQFLEIGIQNQGKISAKDKLNSYDFTYVLNGLGVIVQQIKGNKSNIITKTISSGEFVNNRLHGQGCKHVVGEKAIYGKFVDGNIRSADVVKLSQEKDDEMKRLQLKRIKNVHIHSLKFYNNYSNERPIFLLLNLLEMVTPRINQNSNHK